MNLTDTAIRSAKPKGKPYKLTDGQGMYLLVNKSGKYFRFDYRFTGKRKTLALGPYPKVKLKQARKMLAEARAQLDRGIDPAQHRKLTKGLKSEQAENSFEAVAREWFTKTKPSWTERHAQVTIRRLEYNALPWIGDRPISEITPPELLTVLRRIESRGAIETAHRVKTICGQVFRYAVATGRAERDPSQDLRGALSPRRPKHMAAITDPKKVGELLRNIDGYKGHFITRCALKIAPLTFVRPGELRHAEWSEFDLDTDNPQWKIPSEKMKMKAPHIVPLSTQAVAVLNEIKPLTGNGRYVFPSLRSTQRPMSENTVLVALRTMGYSKEEVTGHGFRSMASTLLHEHSWPSEVIERQLAHSERNSVKAAYNHAEHLPERRRMMQAWADYLDGLKAGGTIIPLQRATK